MEKDEYDWIFDYALQFLESDKFDAAVMDFVDEKCVYFENTEENKFIYSDIHDEFRQHIEALIASNLGELGLTTELFFESCQKARNRRDINQTVFERLTAIDDFQTFKKVMTKRNIELQIEAMQNTYNDEFEDGENTSHRTRRRQSGNNSSSGENSSVLRDEMYTSASEKFRRAAREGDYHDAKMTSVRYDTNDAHDFEGLEADEEKLQDILRQSLLELEILHRQAELEQHQLEQALAMSLAIEEDRLRCLLLNSNASNGMVNYNKGDFSGRSSIHTGRMGNITGRSDNGGNNYDESYYYEYYTSGRDNNPYRADAKLLESKSITSRNLSPNKNDDDDDDDDDELKVKVNTGIVSNTTRTNNINNTSSIAEVGNASNTSSSNGMNESDSRIPVYSTQPRVSAIADPKQPLPTLNTIRSTHLSNTGISGFKGTALPPISSNNNSSNSSNSNNISSNNNSSNSSHSNNISSNNNSSNSSNSNNISSIESEVQLLNEKRKEIQSTLQKNQLQLQQQKLMENQLRHQIDATNTSSSSSSSSSSATSDTQKMNQNEADKRAVHMKDQRDKLIAMKKAEREKKVVEEEKRMNRKGVMAATRATERQVEDAVHRLNQQAEKQVDPSSSSSSSVEVENERKRNNVRLALARRMKIDLIQQQVGGGGGSEMDTKELEHQESKYTNNSNVNHHHHHPSSIPSSSSVSSEQRQQQQQQQQQSIENYAYFDKRLKEAERVRVENQEKAQLLSDKIKLQQQQQRGGRE